jgi:Proteolysis_6 C-terminal
MMRACGLGDLLVTPEYFSTSVQVKSTFRGHYSFIDEAATNWISALVGAGGDENGDESRLISTRPQVLQRMGSTLRLRYPIFEKPNLIPLPYSYTLLHSQLTSASGYSSPALCLICGAVMEANGKGHCTVHTKMCCKDSGVIFLLQDCTVLLSIGPRCSYFPAPYVDEYGEKHKHFRGKPLHLDGRRYEALRRLWSGHGVGNEVYQKRSTSARVIINGHY